MKVKVVTEIDDFLKLEEAFSKLISVSLYVDPFSLFSYIKASIEVFIRRGLRVYIVLNAKGELISFFPLFVDEIKIGFKTVRILRHVCCHVTDYSCFLVDKRVVERDVVKKIYRQIEMDCELKIFSFLYLENLPDSNSSLVILRKIISENARCLDFPNVRCPILEYSKPYKNKKQLSDISRRERRISESHELSVYVGVEFDVEVFEKLKNFHYRKYGYAGFSRLDSQEFYMRLKSDEDFRECIEFSYLTIDAEVSAVHFGFRTGNSVYYYVPAYDENSESGVGLILLNHMVEFYGSKSYKRFDFLRGDEGYKSAFYTDVITNFTVLAKYNSSFSDRFLIWAFGCYKLFKRILFIK